MLDPVRLDRVLARLPVGLRVLQRLDLLRPQLPSQPGAVRRRTGHDPEPGIFIVDDVAFIHAEHGLAIGEAIARRGIRRSTTSRRAATCCSATRKCSGSGETSACSTCSSASRRSTRRASRAIASASRSGKNFEALEFARSLGINVAINLIADPDWDHDRFRIVRQWCLEIPEIVNISVNTPYPGTETWHTQARKSDDPRLPAVRHPARGAADHACRSASSTRSWWRRSRCST